MFTKLVRVCQAVLLLTAFSRRIFKHKTSVTWKYQTMLYFFVAVRSCSRSSYLLSFIDIFAINSLLFWPKLYTCRPTCWVRHFATRLLPAFGSCWQRIASWIGREAARMTAGRRLSIKDGNPHHSRSRCLAAVQWLMIAECRCWH